MKLFDPKYLDVLEKLIERLRVTGPPLLAADVYASIAALVNGALSDARDNPDIEDHHKMYSKGQFNGVLLYSRHAAFLVTDDARNNALNSAKECVGKIRAQLS
jgi:hypothetical protein